MNNAKKNITEALKLLNTRIGILVCFTLVTTSIIFSVVISDDHELMSNHLDVTPVANMTHAGNSSYYKRANDVINMMFTPNVEKKIVQESKDTPFAVQEIPNPYLSEGQRAIISSGRSGQIINEFQQILVNGEIKETTQLTTREISPITQRVYVGMRKPSLNMPSVALDDYGNPIHYKLFLPNRVATAYTSNPGALTSTGRAAAVGLVAVNPKDIPYHSKLYIKSPDGSFIYGYAIAADTGSAMRKGQADIDLYYNSVGECMKFGRRHLDVYILED